MFDYVDNGTSRGLNLQFANLALFHAMKDPGNSKPWCALANTACSKVAPTDPIRLLLEGLVRRAENNYR